MSEKKKRGRKPKNNIIINENPVFDTSNHMNNLIIKLKADRNVKKDEILCGYENINEYCEINQNTGNLHCWNCSYTIDGNNFGLPIKYYNSIFYTIGNFCSLGCCARYTFDNYNGQELYDIYSNINFFNNKWKRCKNEKVIVSPSKTILEKFGGKMKIEEYRNIDKNTYLTQLPPIIPVTSHVHFHETNISEKNNSELKLYRKNQLKNKNNIFLTMNIEKDENNGEII